ncbi:Bacteroides conjugative transposon TraJ protein [Mucilaginibacter lappiensis]|uniref:Conjugative transposon TraJ protein n=1 Tax=Mucilaginibacter lappiensis TaxID=354630 RepID=A0ABR6PFZ9_9SPHI|nr:conjugative transposon protein TraJ [Mucilaginibacter lappiensis]MBB6108679.1 conjugative transposon TraJ protein [Mucilaginibacter lappiensis]SIQ28092.1 Bacteroides conjugative transposon TraJ protein [Mucilaginibacter lappiensis]
MKNKILFTGIAIFLISMAATNLQAQDITSSLQGMQPILNNVYDQMIPMCSNLIDAARGIAGFAALWYIASRVWRQIAHAEPLDFYPLLRPFALGMAIMMFPVVISLMNGIMQPIVSATGAMVKNSDSSIALLLNQKRDAIKNSSAYQMYIGDDGQGDRQKWYKYTHPDDQNQNEGTFESIGDDVKFWMDKQAYNFKNSIKQWMSEILQVLYAAAILCINTIRTFYLIVLAILGPLVFGFAVFDGLQHSLQQWLARYINIFLWLPIANIFGAIIGQVQQQMIKLDISQIQSAGDTFFSSTDTAYLVFLCIGIVGYFSVPSVANYVIHAHGGNGLLTKVTSVAATTVGAAPGVAAAVGDRAEQARSNILNLPNDFMDGYRGTGSNYQKDKLAGK